LNNSFIGVLKYAYVREEEGKNFYKSRMNDLKNEQSREIFEMLTEMESDHMNTIKELILNIENEEPFQFDHLKEAENIFEKRELKEIVGGEVNNLTSDLSIVRMAYLIEEDFVKFYEDAASKTKDENLKEILITLAKWEKSHRDMLNNHYRDLSKLYWSEMGFEPLF